MRDVTGWNLPDGCNVSGDSRMVTVTRRTTGSVC
jgi:hypothetical protein